MKNWPVIILLGVLLAALAVGTRPIALAAPGEGITTIPLAVPGVGVSVGADCNGNVYYTNSGDPRIHKMNRNGILLASLPTKDASGTDIFIDEIAWDQSRLIFWGAEHGVFPVRIYKINPQTGATTLAFTSQTNGIGTFIDGLAFDPGKFSDPKDDEILISTDVSSNVDFYRTDGTFLRSVTPKNAQGGALGAISGVLVGVGDLLYLGQDGRSQIVEVKKSTGDFIGNFASPGGVRDEGLECDPINFAPKLVLLSRELNPPGFISVIEVEKGTCVCGGGSTPPPPPGAARLVVRVSSLTRPGHARTVHLTRGRNGIYTAVFPLSRGTFNLRVENVNGFTQPLEFTVRKNRACQARLRVRIVDGQIESVQ
jgi:hypothetical protein